MTNPEPVHNERITRDPDVVAGHFLVKATGIPVALVLSSLANNPDLDDLLAAHPGLTVDDVKAVLDFARAVLEVRQREQGGNGKGAETAVAKRLTNDEQERGLAALSTLRGLRAEDLNRRGGKRYPNSAELIQQMRDRRSQELMRGPKE